jgi:hypothetical protein
MIDLVTIHSDLVKIEESIPQVISIHNAFFLCDATTAFDRKYQRGQVTRKRPDLNAACLRRL